MPKFKSTSGNRGVAMMIAMIMLAVIAGLSTALLSYVTSNTHTAKLFESGLTSVQIAEAGLHKAIYCIKAENGEGCGGTFGTDYVGEDGVSFEDGEFNILIDCVGDAPNGGGCVNPEADFLVTVTGTDITGKESTIQATLSKSPTISNATTFDFAVLVGGYGVNFSNNAVVCQGDVYSASDITCDNNSELVANIYVTTDGGEINNCAIGGQAAADRIIDSEICCDAYYDDHPQGISGSTVHGIRHAGVEPAGEQEMPLVELGHWREIAEHGGVVNGDFEPEDGDTIGPIKVTGDLILNIDVDVTVAGPIWVIGDVIMNNNSSMSLAPEFNSASTIVLADNPADNSAGGHIELRQNAYVTGSNTPGSYFLFVSTNDSLETDGSGAIEVNNNAAGDAIFYAMNGSVRLSNNSVAAAVAGQKVELAQNAVVSYGCEVACEMPSGDFCECDEEEAVASLLEGLGQKFAAVFGMPEAQAVSKKDKDEEPDNSCWCEAQTESQCPTPAQLLLADGPEEWDIVRGTWHEKK